MKRIAVLLLIISLTLPVISCTSNTDEVDNSNAEEKEITIIMSNHNTITNVVDYEELTAYTKHLMMFMNKFTEETGIKVRLIRTISNTQDEYLTQRNLQLYLDKGPTLVLISGGEGYSELINSGAALEVSDKLTNYSNLYDSQKDGYFVPVSMAAKGFLFNNLLMEKFHLDIPKLDWKLDNYLDIYYKYYSQNKGHISTLFWLEINPLVDEQMKLISNSNKSQLASNEIVVKLISLRELVYLSEKHITNKEYTYENYYNMLFNYNSVEELESIEAMHEIRKQDPRILIGGSSNILNPIETNKYYQTYISSEPRRNNDVSKDDTTLLPNPIRDYYSWGFIVNRNGHNVEEGLKFVDYLISNEAQLRLFREYDDGFHRMRGLSFSAPVIKTIEDEITEVLRENNVDEHLINVRDITLSQIESGERNRAFISTQLTELSDEMTKLFAKIIFADKEYTSEEIMRELREFDNRVNLMLSE